MQKPLFIFTQHTNSFSIHIPNLEELSVQKIQEIESFVRQRHGVFDFESYTFSIQKRINFKEFCNIVTLTNLNAVMQEKSVTTNKAQRISFGKYKGLLYSELPDFYLIWLKRNYMGKERDAIAKEIQSRGF
jgi:hypothetical protein